MLFPFETLTVPNERFNKHLVLIYSPVSNEF